ncbi:family 78 glycoside hydrolase catalytic domain [Planctomonas psychrotolerans]|uniref:family 78 glycoside hydrolase catalytic domain n=1 Tax=Planctomonas psychrotolerans TaxID=2528712 RepID=UPI0012385504|nr:family 78 glycoside hydrolase catalytic domain [Planctomonas psychrotolerans]
MTDTASVPTVGRLTLERRRDLPLVATPTPRLSWATECDARDWIQASAEIDIDGEVHRHEGSESVSVEWPSTPLRPRERRTVRVRVHGTDGSTSDWSTEVEATAAFLADGEWRADFVGLDAPDREAQPVLLRREFTPRGPVARATLYATAQGAYQVQLNGRDVDDEVLKPGWTAYQYRLLHETTDVTALLVPGPNAIGITTTGAWYTEEYGAAGAGQRFYGDQPAAAAQLHLDYADGSAEVLCTDGSWRATGDFAITASGIYAGEEHDARRVREGWSTAGFDDADWSPVRTAEGTVVPTAGISEPVRRVSELPVDRVLRTPSGKTVLDFGQNLVGRLRIRVTGDAGTVITLRHAEVLEHDELGTRPLRFAAATDRYTLAGGGSETWEPEFTFHGFRYAEVGGWPGELDPADVTAVVLSSDMRRTGWFDCSNALVTRLHENVVWGMRGNFLSLPTDCPQRDERLGWTGDIQVFAPTASFLFDCDAFLASWLADLRLEQQARDGVVPFVVPNSLPFPVDAAAAWGDAATIVPSVLFERFGDRQVLAESYESMRAWVDTLLGIAGPRMLWEGQFQFGDWLDPDAPPDQPGAAKTDSELVASAYLYRSTSLLAAAAGELGRADDAVRYGDLAEAVRTAFVREYVTEAGRMLSDATTAYALAIRFGIVTDEERLTTMGDRLASLVRAADYTMTTGFVGTPLIQGALVQTGHADVAERLLTQTRIPSWLYAVTMGATTIWERWDSMLEDGSINPGEMTSFNHYALGAIADWLHTDLAGLAPAEPGYRRLRIRPLVLDGFDHATASHETPYGLAESGWRRDGDSVVVTAVVPPNARADVHLPGSVDVVEVGSGAHSWTVTVPPAVQDAVAR